MTATTFNFASMAAQLGEEQGISFQDKSLTWNTAKDGELFRVTLTLKMAKDALPNSPGCSGRLKQADNSALPQSGWQHTWSGGGRGDW